MSAGEREGHMKGPHRKLLRLVEPALFAVWYHASRRSPAFMFPAPSGRRSADEPRENPR
jgi:hypothetical protein